MYIAFTALGTLNSRRAASALVRLAEGGEKWEAPDHPLDVFSQKWREPSKIVLSPLWCSKLWITTEKIELREDLKSRRGLAVSLEIICHNCGESTSTMSSKISNKCYDVNLRLTYGMRAIGKGGAAARIFCGLMNLPPPPAKFERHNSLF
ncbi:uncharacterized protein TNCV_4034611 [Trichonephila clavipes]|nr:uncharacterized protein TNCV_4034611 [Trichonephila clavipes]